MSGRTAEDRVLVVGRGRLGSSLVHALRASGARVWHWSARGRWPARAPTIDVVLMAASDPFIEATARRLATRLDVRTPVLHASGALGTGPLAPLAPRPMGVLHPLVSFASKRPPPLEGAVAVVAGDPRAVRAARRLGERLRLRVIAAGIHGPRYHAAAALIANGAAALATRAVRALELEGVRRRDAERAVAGLLRSVADNVARVGVPAALTGPIVRGDARTVAAHRAALDPITRAAYDAIAPVILDVAREAGLPRARARAIRVALHQSKR